MKKLVLVRHGQSQWNLENLFTGWTDVDLTEQGQKEATTAAQLLQKEGIFFQTAFTSYLKRAIKTLNIILDVMDLDWIDVHKTWRLNEKHYGALQGLNKKETAAQYGQEQVLLWRRSFDTAPAALEYSDARAPHNDRRYQRVARQDLPLTESLKDTIARIMPYWEVVIKPVLIAENTVLIVAHGNSLRAIIKHLKGISETEITDLNLPTGIPYVFEFDDDMNLCADYFLGDAEAIKKLQESVAKQSQ